jgi:hypothetical protein
MVREEMLMPRWFIGWRRFSAGMITGLLSVLERK